MKSCDAGSSVKEGVGDQDFQPQLSGLTGVSKAIIVRIAKLQADKRAVHASSFQVAASF